MNTDKLSTFTLYYSMWHSWLSHDGWVHMSVLIVTILSAQGMVRTWPFLTHENQKYGLVNTSPLQNTHWPALIFWVGRRLRRDWIIFLQTEGNSSFYDIGMRVEELRGYFSPPEECDLNVYMNVEPKKNNGRRYRRYFNIIIESPVRYLGVRVIKFLEFSKSFLLYWIFGWNISIRGGH